MWITTNFEKFLKRREYQTTLPAFWETCIPVKKQQLEEDMDRLVKKLAKECVKVVYCHPAHFYLEYIIQSARLDESQAGIKISRRNINNLRYADDNTLMAES